MTHGTAELGHRLRTSLSDGFKPRLQRLRNEGHLTRHAAPGSGPKPSPPAVTARARTRSANSTTATKLLLLVPYRRFVQGQGRAAKDANEPRRPDTNPTACARLGVVERLDDLTASFGLARKSCGKASSDLSCRLYVLLRCKSASYRLSTRILKVYDHAEGGRPTFDYALLDVNGQRGTTLHLVTYVPSPGRSRSSLARGFPTSPGCAGRHGALMTHPPLPIASSGQRPRRRPRT